MGISTKSYRWGPLIGDEAVIQAKVTREPSYARARSRVTLPPRTVKLRAPAVFNGSMKTPMLSIEDGVLFNGGLEMTHGVREGATLHPVAMTPSPG